MAESISRNRLATVLGMMGSEHDGEALSAARLAERMRQKAGIGWNDLLAADSSGPLLPPGVPPWRYLTDICLRRRDLLTPW